jgi:hypothetical protein
MAFPGNGLRMFTKTADSSKYVEIIKGKHITIKRSRTRAHPFGWRAAGMPVLILI